jgi:hypothetical protein
MKLFKRLPRLNQVGFSLPELLSVMIVSSLFVGLILFFMFSYWRYAALLEADLDTFVTRLNAGDFLRETLNGSTGLIIQNGIPDNNTLAPDPSIASNLYWQPLHAIPGNVPVGNTGIITPLLYFKRLSINTDGDIIMNGTQPYEDEYIIYLDGTAKQLLIRYLANPYANDNRLLTSCPPALATANCPADKTIADNLASIDIRYFARSGTTIDYTSIYDSDINAYIGPDFPVVEAVEFTVNLTKKPFLQKTNATTNQTVVRIALRNT